MATSLPDKEVRDLVLRLDGYALTGSVRDHVFPIHYGGGRNGKGAHERMMLHVTGDYGRKVPIELFMARKGDPHPTEKATLFGVRYASSSENEEGSQFAVAQVKTLTGGDVVSCRRMREDFWEFWPTHKFQLHVNHKSRIKESKDAIWDRVLLIPWTQKFEEEQQDKELDSKLKAEASGIFNVLLKACLDWQARGLRAPLSIKAANEEYRRENDVLGRFIEDCCVVAAGKQVRSKALYDAFTAWCEEQGMKAAWTQQAFTNALKEKGYTVDWDSPRKKFRVWMGLLLASEAREAALQADVDAIFADAKRAVTGSDRAPEEGALPQLPQADGNSPMIPSAAVAAVAAVGIPVQHSTKDIKGGYVELPTAPTAPTAPSPASEEHRTETRLITGVTRYSDTCVVVYWADGLGTRSRDLDGEVAVIFLRALPPIPEAPMGHLRGRPHTKLAAPRKVEFTLRGTTVVTATLTMTEASMAN